MTDLDTEIGALFKKQSAVLSESEYRSQVDEAAAELFKRQPQDVGLPVKAFTAIIVSLLVDYRLSLADVKKRVFGKFGLQQINR